MKRIFLIAQILLLVVLCYNSYSQDSNYPIQLIIKSDKSVHETGEQIKIFIEFKNISNDPIYLDDSYITDPVDNFYISNDYGEEFSQILITSTGHFWDDGKLEPNESFSDNWRYLDMNEFKPGVIVLDDEGNTYRLAGKYRVYAKRGDLVSNTITIELVPKSSQEVASDWRDGNNVCAVHGIEMETEVVNGLEGFIDFLPEYYEAKEKRFPNAGSEYPPQLYSAEKGKIYVCPKCVQAKKNWEMREKGNNAP